MATKWSEEFLSQRMDVHRRYQRDLEAQYLSEIIDEVQALPGRKPRTGDLFSMLPDLPDGLEVRTGKGPQKVVRLA